MARRKRVSTAKPVLLSVADVAIQIGVCRQTVYNYINHEGLPAIEIRGMLRIDPNSLEAWIRAHERQRSHEVA
ncbi:MAG TPA: helix-turn-helix domain-containing protein [Ktedonobacteraceae bacterium]|nr:helix-turn-helix domain-containing protein [Ktedonobacteraceae bacterium]